jgi:uncharacterized protein (DUF2141 family)
MNDLTIRKSEVTSTDMNLGMLGPIRVLSLVLCVGLVFANLPVIALAQSSCPGIHVEILNIRNNAGAVACAFFSEAEGFPAKFLRFADKIVLTKVEGRKARCDFAGIKPGTYAIAVIHDENLNGELDTNFLGVPTEGYGFSSGAKAAFSAPSFSDAKVSYDGQTLDLTISLNY